VTLNVNDVLDGNSAGPDETPKRYEFGTYAEFTARKFPVAEPLLGDPVKTFLAVGSLLMVYGADGSGKSTWMIDGIVHLAAGVDWLGIPVPRPVRVCVIENEGPPSLFQQKLCAKIVSWDGPDPTPNLFVFIGPWGEFTFAEPDPRAALREYCDQHRIDLVAANPTLGLGVGTSGKPDETGQFVDWLVECGLKSTRAFWLLHHENKAGQISGDWGRHPDTKVFLQRDGNHQRTRLDWAKTRWATLDPEEKIVLLEWVTETQGYTVTQLDTVGASDDELDEKIAAYLTKHPAASTRGVHANVKGTDGGGSPWLVRWSTVMSREEPVSEPKPDGKPFAISKRLVWEAWRRLKANKGAAGVDEESIQALRRA
jgi:AAA domain